MCPVAIPSASAKRRRVQRKHHHAAVATPAAELAAPLGAGGDGRGELGIDARAIVGLDGRHEAGARQLVERQAEQVLDAGVGVEAAAGGVGDEHAGREGVAERINRRPTAALAGESALEGRTIAAAGHRSSTVYPTGTQTRPHRARPWPPPITDEPPRRLRYASGAVFVLQRGGA